MKLGIFALFLGAFLVYLVSVNGTFLYDDLNQIVFNDSLHHLNRFASILFDSNRQSRPLMNLSFAINWTMANGESWPFHLTNILIHLVNAALVWRLLKKLFPKQPNLALATTFLFLFHPFQAEAVSYVMGRVSLLETLFFLVGIELYLTSSRPRISFLVFLFIAPLAKETLILLPLLLLLYDFTVGGFKIRNYPFKSRWHLLIPFWVLPYWLLRPSTLNGHTGAVGFHLFPFWEYLVTQMHYVFYRLVLVFSLTQHSIVHEYPAQTTNILISAIAGLAVVVISGVWAIYNWRRYPAAVFFVLIFLLLGVGLYQGPLQFINPFAEYRCYFSNLSVFLLLAYIFDRGLSTLHSRFLKVSCVCAALSLVVVFSFLEQTLFAHPRALVQHSLDNYPQSKILHEMMGKQYQQIGDFQNAEKEYLTTDRLYAENGLLDARSKLTLIQLYVGSQQWEKALKIFEDTPRDAFDPPSESYFRYYAATLEHFGLKNQLQALKKDAHQIYPELWP